MFKVIYSDFFYVVCNSCSPVVYRYEISKPITKIDPISQETKFGKKVLKFSSDKDAYYIIQTKTKTTILRKGNLKYLAFLIHKNPSDDEVTVRAYFIDGSTEDKTFKKLTNNIYVCDLSREIRIGWFKVGNTIASINRYAYIDAESLTVSDIENSNVKKTSLHSSSIAERFSSAIERNSINDTILQPKISSQIKRTTIKAKKETK